MPLVIMIAYCCLYQKYQKILNSATRSVIGNGFHFLLLNELKNSNQIKATKLIKLIAFKTTKDWDIEIYP